MGWNSVGLNSVDWNSVGGIEINRFVLFEEALNILYKLGYGVLFL